jgi:hypothetical protein
MQEAMRTVVRSCPTIFAQVRLWICACMRNCACFVQARKLKPMNLARVYANAAVLPDGKVFITGGASTPKEFSDEYAHFKPGVQSQLT